MSAPWVEQSVDRWTGRVCWGYAALLVAVFSAHLPQQEEGWLATVVYFTVFMLVYVPLAGAAAERSNPLERYRAWASGGGPP